MISKNKIKKIIEAIKDTEINEISISSFWGFQKIKMSKSQSNSNIHSNLNKHQNSELVTENIKIHELEDSKPDADIKDDDNNLQERTPSALDDASLTIISAPLVGTFYASSKPGEPPYVDVGDEITKGKPLCIVEAMKIFNEIESDYNGVIVEVLIKDGEPVEYGQPLYKIKEQ